ncbi:glycoside hydrolase family 128 protein, partial [Aureobasidium melanogenum]
MLSIVTVIIAFLCAADIARAHLIQRAPITSASIIKKPRSIELLQKRGLSFNNVTLTEPFGAADCASEVSWSYNWGQTVDFSKLNSALDFYPMLWSDAAGATSQWAANAQDAIDHGSTNLLAFNEPDVCYSGSACMDIDASVSAYKTYMDPFAGKALLGSPSVTNQGGTSGATWLQNFIGNCTGCQIDFVCMHWYSNKWAGATYFKEQVQAIRDVAGGRPILVTEFGLTVDDQWDTYTDDDLADFLEDVMGWMDDQDDIKGYAYFMDAPGYLINSAGTSMSDIGVLYNNYTAAVASSSATSGSVGSDGAVPTIKTSSSTSTSQSSPLTSLIAFKSSTALTSRSKSSTSLSSTRSSSSTASPSRSSLTLTASTTISSLPTVSATSTRTSSSISRTSSAGASSSPIKILSAYFADTNVTAAALKVFSQQGNLVINTDTLLSSLAIDDPWPGTIKTLSILYTQGGTRYIFTSKEQSGTFNVAPSTIPSDAAVPMIGATHGASIDLVAVVWGALQINTTSVFDRLYNQQATRWGFQISDDLFGVDGLPGVAKVGILWFLDESGTLRSVVGREGNWVQF